MAYGKVHRFLLRSLASRGVMTVVEVERVLLSFIGEDENSQVSIDEYVKEINDTIRPFQQTIKVTNDELTNEEVAIFLSLAYDDATKAQNFFSATELEYFRLLIEQIMTTEARQISGIHAVNIVGQMKSSFNKTDAQKLLNTWCQMRYLDKDGVNYALGVRAIHEFEGYLRQNMPDTIEECCLCKQIVFRGFNCPSCGKAVHTRCLNRYLEKIQKWPCCKEDFNADQLEQLQCEVAGNTGSPTINQHGTGNKKPSLENSRLSQSEISLPGPSTSEAMTVEPTMLLEDTEMDLTQDVIPEISQRITKKRKRQP